MGRHHLNAGVLLVASAFFASAVFLTAWSPRDLGQGMLAQIGAVGVTLGVLPNPDNTLAAQLRERQEALERKDRVLSEKEALLTAEALRRDANAIEYSFLGGSLLIALIILNFYFDTVAIRSSRKEQNA